MNNHPDQILLNEVQDVTECMASLLSPADRTSLLHARVEERVGPSVVQNVNF